MISREEKNKSKVKEIKREKNLAISKKIIHIFIIIFIISLSFCAYIYFIGVKGLKTNEYLIKNKNIPASFHGVKILHFSDLLYGQEINENYLIKLTKEIRLINPNIVFFTGNILHNQYNANEQDFKTLNNFFKNIPYTIGKYVIKGDTDNNNFDLIMENTDFSVLNNECVSIYNNKLEYINVIGISNINNQIITKSDDSYTITLINNYDEYANFNIFSNLVLAGNNLGGEIKLFNHSLLGNNKYMNNFYQEKETTIYISSGIGSIHHIRFMNHPSINVYRLIAK